MKTPLEILHKYFHHFKSERTRDLVIRAMMDYAKIYHNSEVKKMGLSSVAEQRELLKAFVNWQINGRTPYAGMLINEHIDDFLKCHIML